AKGKGRDQEKENSPSVEEEQVRDHLWNLKVHNSMEPDEIHPWLLRELADEAVNPLYVIAEKSWHCGEVPTDWKWGNITPSFIKGEKEDPGNNRPVSLTSVPGKIMEQILPNVLLRHEENVKVV
ncbi:hypothetical protein N300_13210, partial [Calypte anna]